MTAGVSVGSMATTESNGARSAAGGCGTVCFMWYIDSPSRYQPSTSRG